MQKLHKSLTLVGRCRNIFVSHCGLFLFFTCTFFTDAFNYYFKFKVNADDAITNPSVSLLLLLFKSTFATKYAGTILAPCSEYDPCSTIQFSDWPPISHVARP